MSLNRSYTSIFYFMKKLLFCLFFLLYTLSIFAQYQPDFYDICKIADMEKKKFHQSKSIDESFVGENYDMIYHRFEWEIDPAVYYIKGKVLSYFKATENDVNQISFDLSTNLTVHNIIFHENEINFSHENNVLTLNLNENLIINKLDSVEISYEGEPYGETGFGAFIKSTHSQVPIIWTLSEPYGSKEWFPCKHSLNDKIDSIDIFVKTPADYKVASNGLLQSEEIEGNYRLTHWKHRHAIAAYLIAIAVTNYEVSTYYIPIENGTDSVKMVNYLYPEYFETLQTHFAQVNSSMQLFSDLFIPYPFKDEKYGHTQFGWGGGMEHQTMSFMGGSSYALIAHELAHQWFGDYITCGTWSDIWLNEGFATYLEGLTTEHGLQNITFENWLIGKNNAVTSAPDGSVFVEDTTSVSRIFSSRLSYSKGALVLHMLRWTLGDEDFFQAIRNYLNDENLRHNYAKTADLKFHLENQSGLDLTEFFADWYYGEGYPSYQLFADFMTNHTKIKINQIQSHNSVDFFEMKVPVLFKNYNETGNDTTVIFEHTSSGEEFIISDIFSADEVIFDPEHWIISKNNSLVVGIDELEKENELIHIFPVPSKNKIKIQSYENVLITNLEIFNSFGKKVHSLKLENKNIIDIDLDLLNLSNGIYFLKIKTKEEKIFIKKVVKI